MQVLKYDQVDVIHEDDKHSNLQVSVIEIGNEVSGVGSFHVGACRLS
jgi:hypothetical protein